MRKFILFIFILASIELVYADIWINEVMYNPSGNDNNKEFIEVFSDEPSDLEGYIIEDSDSSDTLTLLFRQNSPYSLIVEEGFKYSNLNASIYSLGATIGNNLNNDKDLIIFQDSSNAILDVLSYSDSWGADGNDYSLCKIPDKIGIWQECNPTPGTKNADDTNLVDYVIDGDTFVLKNGDQVRLIGIDTPEIGEYYYTEAKNRLIELVEEKQIALEPDVENKDKYNRLLRYLYIEGLFINRILVEEGFAIAYPYDPNTKYEDEFEEAENHAKELKKGIWSDSKNYSSDIIINEFLPNPAGDDNAPMPAGEFIELYNSGDNDSDLVASYLMDSANHKLYITDTTTIDGTIVKAKDYLAVYTNSFSGFLNNEGFEEIRLYDSEGKLIDKVNYADSKESLSWSLVNNFWQYRLPTPNQINFENEPEMESYFEIERIENLGSDDEAEFGDIVKVRFNVYKGDTNKKSIKLYIENDDDRITKITKATLYDKFTNYSFTLPLQIYPNCKEKYKEGKYYVKLGWTSESEPEDEFKIKIYGINMDNCGKIYVEKKPRGGTVTHNLLEYPESVEIGEEFPIIVELTNNDGNSHYLDLYSYVYRGSKSYSPSREANKKKVLVKAGETKEFELINLVEEADPGEYKLKVKIKREDQKTTKEITKDIVLENKKPIETAQRITAASISSAQMPPPLVIINPKTSKIIYESTDIKIKKLIPYFMIASFTIFTIILIIKNKEKE